MVARLGSDDYTQFRSGIDEIAVGEFLAHIGEIDWRPAGRDSRVGEFNLIPNEGEPIFVEVKSIFASSEERKRDRNWDTLRQVAHETRSLYYITAEIKQLECEINPRHFRSWLTTSILNQDQIDNHQRQKVTFNDKDSDGNITEVEVQFTKVADDLSPTGCGFISGGFVNLPERIREIIDGAIDQLPNTVPTLVVISDAESVGVDEFGIRIAMFSYPKIRYKIFSEPHPNVQQDEPTLYHDLEGIVQKKTRTRLSAIGTWHLKWIPKMAGTLEIYHNPLTAKKIPRHVFEVPNVYQLIHEEPNIMRWVPELPSE